MGINMEDISAEKQLQNNTIGLLKYTFTKESQKLEVKL